LSAFLEKAVVQFGIDPLIADEYTPYELYLIGKQVQERNFREFENALTVAWHTEAFARQRRLPKLEKILKEVRKPSRKAESRSDAILKAMAAAKGVIIK
jgi:hypothetical protein